MSGRRHLRWLLLAFCCALGPAVAGEPLRLLFVGDIMLDDGPGQLIAAGADPLAPFAALLEESDYRIPTTASATSSARSPPPARRSRTRSPPSAPTRACCGC